MIDTGNTQSATVQAPVAPQESAPKPVANRQAPAATQVLKEAVQKSQVRIIPVAPPSSPVPDEPVGGQAPLSGTVIDQDGAVVSGAAYAVYKILDSENEETKNLIASGFTDTRGRFQASVPPGIVEITVSQEGFKSAVIRGIKTIEGVPTTIRATLQIGGGNQVVLITARVQSSMSEGAEPTGGSLVPAKVVKRVDPIYPEEARQQKIEGIVMLEVQIGADGSVSNIRLIKGVSQLNDAAIRTVEQWRYSPAYLNGQPRSCTVTATLIFKM